MRAACPGKQFSWRSEAGALSVGTLDSLSRVHLGRCVIVIWVDPHWNSLQSVLSSPFFPAKHEKQNLAQISSRTYLSRANFAYYYIHRTHLLSQSGEDAWQEGMSKKGDRDWNTKRSLELEQQSTCIFTTIRRSSSLRASPSLESRTHRS